MGNTNELQFEYVSARCTQRNKQLKNKTIPVTCIT